MKILKKYLAQFFGSLSKPHSYLAILDQKGTTTFFYFYLAITVLGAVSAAGIYFWFRPTFLHQLGQVRADIIQSFPADHQIRFDGQTLSVTTQAANGQVATQSSELIIPSPDSIPKLFGLPPTQMAAWKRNWPANLVIIAPQHITDPNAFLAERSTTALILMDPTAVHIYDGRAKWQDGSLSEMHMSSGMLDRTRLETISSEWQNQVTAAVTKYAWLIWPVVIVWQLISLSFNLLWYSILLLLIMKVFGYRFWFSRALKFSAYVLVVAQLINQISLLINPWLSIDMQSLSFWTITTYLLWSLRTHLTKTSQALVK